MRARQWPKVKWTDERLRRLVRLRFRTTPGFPFMDVDLCYGLLTDGRMARVELPFETLPRKHYYGAMLDYARRDDVFLKGLGVFEGTVISLLVTPRRDGEVAYEVPKDGVDGRITDPGRVSKRSARG